jgi:hypothetical protein
MFLGAMVLGLVGLVAMSLLGFAYGHAAHGHSAHGHADSSHGAHGHSGHSHSSHGHAPHDSSATKFLALISPRVLFSLALGFGAFGLVLDAFLPLLLAVILAAVGALALERLVVYPYWNWLMRFASAPAEMMGDAVRAKARAVTRFDGSGCGLIQLELDGQVRQVLGTLSVEQRGLEVLVGDAVRVESVDARGNCTVSKLL